jgi:hypothetical protein
MPWECRRYNTGECFVVNSRRRRNVNTVLVSAKYDVRQGTVFMSDNIKIYLGDWTEHFDIYPYRKPTNASKWPRYCDV